MCFVLQSSVHMHMLPGAWRYVSVGRCKRNGVCDHMCGTGLASRCLTCTCTTFYAMVDVIALFRNAWWLLVQCFLAPPDVLMMLALICGNTNTQTQPGVFKVLHVKLVVLFPRHRLLRTSSGRSHGKQVHDEAV